MRRFQRVLISCLLALVFTTATLMINHVSAQSGQPDSIEIVPIHWQRLYPTEVPAVDPAELVAREKQLEQLLDMRLNSEQQPPGPADASKRFRSTTTRSARLPTSSDPP